MFGNLLRSLRRLRYIHFGINNAVAWLLVIGILAYLLRDPVSAAYGILLDLNKTPTNGGELLINVIAGAISTLLTVMVVWLLLNFSFRLRRVGEYRAFEVDQSGNETPWGTVTISYYPLAAETQHPQVTVLLHNEEQGRYLKGNGIIVDNTYLAGYYTQVGNDEERRSGAFLYKISADGRTWRGIFTYIDPSGSSDEPGTGTAIWKKI